MIVNYTALAYTQVSMNKKIIARCRDCEKEWMKFAYDFKEWQGRCRDCSYNYHSGSNNGNWKGGIRTPSIRKTSNCVDCNGIISDTAKRCPQCYFKYNSGANNGNWKGGPLMRVRSSVSVECKTCKGSYKKREDTIKNWSGICRKCSNVEKGSKMKGTHRVIVPSCIDCGKISRYIKEGVRCKPCSLRYRSGKNHYHWKGGITKAERILRNRIEYKDWRKSVFERDSYTCQNCSQVGGELNADHIKPFAYFKELRLSIENGRTLCKPCHLKIGWRRTKENLLLLPTPH